MKCSWILLLFGATSTLAHWNSKQNGNLDQTKHKLPTCSNDGLFRIYKDARYSSKASAFCSIYIESTRVIKVTPTTTKLIYISETVVSGILTQFIPVTDTITTGPSADPTITVTPKGKRGFDENCPEPAAQFPASRLSSACSCLVTPATTTKTVTGRKTVTLVIASTVYFGALGITTVTSPVTVDVLGPPAAAVTVHTGPSDPPVLAAYCTGGDIQGTLPDNLDNTYIPQCGMTYVSAGTNDGQYLTAASYNDCLNVSDNCFVVESDTSGGQPDALPDSNVDSAYVSR